MVRFGHRIRVLTRVSTQGSTQPTRLPNQLPSLLTVPSRWPAWSIVNRLICRISWSLFDLLTNLFYLSIFCTRKNPEKSIEKFMKIYKNRKRFLVKEKFWKFIFLILDNSDTHSTSHQRFLIKPKLVQTSIFTIFYLLLFKSCLHH